MSLRSNATPSGNAQRINDTAGMGLHMCLCSSWRSYATRGMTDTGSQRCEANELANPNITHALRKARVDAQAPLRSCCSGLAQTLPLSGITTVYSRFVRSFVGHDCLGYNHWLQCNLVRGATTPSS